MTMSTAGVRSAVLVCGMQVGFHSRSANPAADLVPERLVRRARALCEAWASAALAD